MTRWKRYARGLYVDDTQTLVITSEARDLWSVRRLQDFGPAMDGTMFPEYSATWLGEGNTYPEAKADAERVLAAWDEDCDGPMGPTAPHEAAAQQKRFEEGREWARQYEQRMMARAAARGEKYQPAPQAAPSRWRLITDEEKGEAR